MDHSEQIPRVQTFCNLFKTQLMSKLNQHCLYTNIYAQNVLLVMFPEPYPTHIMETNKSHYNLAPLHPLTISIKTGFTNPANEGDDLDQPTCCPSTC